jgi:hypothetical protein
MTIIYLNAQGEPTSPLDIPTIHVALHTVPGHRLEDDDLATQVILEEARKFKELDVRIGSYKITFKRLQ